MPNAIITAIMFVGNLVMTALPMIEVVFGIGGATMFVTGALAITAGVVGMSKLMEMSIPRPDSNYARQKTVRSTTAPVKRVYGESLISGPVAFMGVGGTGNQDLWHVIALTGDKSEAITDIYLDNVIIPNADINSGNAAGGIVNGTSTIFRPVGSTTLVTVYKYIGGQTAVSQPVASEFFKWTSDHEGQGLTYIATKFSFPDNERIAEVWNKYNPQDIKALVKGMAIYDPRKDSTSPEYDSSLGVSTQRLSDSTTWQWSDNPALCLANYIIDDQFGMGVPSSAIDWAAVHSSADYADALVSIPGSQTQKRFTCNGVLYGTDSHAQNINKILSSMNGSLVYSSGKYVMQAGQYIEPESDAILTDNDLNGPINITVANTRDDRFNTIKGTHFNPQDLHKKVAFPEVQLTDIATRDAGEVLYKEVELPMTNDVYMCQRLTYQMINRSNDQLLIEFPCNLKALRYTVGDRVKITLDKFAGSDQDSISFNQTPFVILGFNFSAEGAVTLTMLKDTQANYTDMPVGNYSTVASDGSITDGFSGVPAPTNLSSVVDGHFVRLTWDNPAPNTTFNDIIVYQSDTSNFSDSSIFIRTKNDALTFSLPSSALTKYYWVRASLYDNEVAATDIIIGQTYRIRNLGTTNWVTLGATAPVSNGDTFLATSSGTSSSGTGIATDESAVSAVVGPETVTTTDQVADSIEWIDVDDAAGLRPDNNATVGATLSVNFKDDDDSTILTATDVKNSVLAQEILRVEVEAGDVLDLETGAEVDIQNLGDVAIYVSNQDALLQGNINTVSTALSNLENTVVDLTSGVSDIYLQATAPVAGVGGVPDPIPDFSRWYDTDDDNAPYYWTGSAWASLEDPRIGANASSIVNLTASLSSTNTNVAANTTLAQGKIQSYFQDAEPTGGTYVTGDLWFDTNDKNKGYRWSGSAWQSIRDTDIDAAVTAASTAQSTADGKIVTFYQDAEPAAGSSSLGDLWIDTNDDNKLYRYNQTGTNPDTFAWQETRDAGISSAISAASTAQSTADGKIVTFIQDDVPADVDSSSGDLWFDTNDKNKLYRYSGTAWDAVRDTDIAQAISDASDAQATADGKVQTFIQNEAPTASDSSLNALFTGDLWIDSNDSNKLYRYTGSVWDAVRDTGIAANAESITVLDSTVSDIDDTVTALSTSNTSLVATIDFITKVSDEDGDVLEDEGSTSETPVVIDMQDLTDVASATGQADQTLQTRVTLTEDTVTIQSTELTLLNSILTDGSGNLTAGANAVSALQTDVTQINTLDGTSTSANASALIALKSTVEDPSTGLSAVGGVVSTLTANVGDGATLVSDAQTLYAITGVVATNNWSSTQEYAVGDGVVSGGLPYVCVLANTNNVPPNATYWSPVNTTAALITDNNVARIGYCVDANGDLTDHKNATLCVAAGNTWNGDAAIAEAVKALRVIQPDGTYATIQEATSVISDDVGDVTAQKFIKIDNNGRIAGYGLYSTTSGGTPDSEFVVVADRFTVVDPTSTGDDPIQPFTVTSNKIFLSTDVQVDGDLLTTGTTISNLDLIVGSGASYFKVSSDGLQLGNETFDSAPFRVTPAGALTATGATISGAITATSLSLSEGITIAKSVVGLTNVDDVSQATIQSDTLTAATSSDVGLGSVENLDAQNQAQTGLIAGTTITGGGITMSSGGAIKTTGKDSESDTTNGYFLGYNSSSTKYTFGIGDADRSMVWDGSKLNISGDSISLRTGGDVDYTSDSRYPTSVKSSAITLTSDSDYFLFDTRFQDIAFPEFLVTYNLGPLTSGTQSGLTAANEGIMDQIKVEVFYSDASSGSPSTWVSFASKTVGKIYTWNESNSAIYFNFRVKQVDLGGGNYRADLDTRSGILDDYPLSAAPFSSYFGGTSVPVGLVDEDYNINIPVYRNTFVLPKGKYFIKTVITVTDGSTSPYPSTGSPTATNRIVSIANANNYTHPDYGQSSYYQGNPKTTFVDPDDKGMTLLNGNSVYLMTREGDSGDEGWQNAMFFGGRGTSNANAAYGNLHGLYFYNDRDDIGNGNGIVGSLGSVNHAITVPYLGDSLNITATGNGIKFNGGYGSTGATIDTNGNYFANGNITISGTVSQGSDARLKTDVETIDGSKVFDMRGVSFTKAGKKGAGVIAQELQEIAPELVHEDQDGVLSVAYGDIVGYLIEAIKTLKQEIESIKADD